MRRLQRTEDPRDALATEAAVRAKFTNVIDQALNSQDPQGKMREHVKAEFSKPAFKNQYAQAALLRKQSVLVEKILEAERRIRTSKSRRVTELLKIATFYKEQLETLGS